MTTSTAEQPLRALIVDDDPRWRAIVAEILSELGFSIAATAAPPETPHDYQLAVLDIALDPSAPDNRDGLNLMKRLIQVDTRCVILSGLVNADLMAELEQPPNVLAVLQKDEFRRDQFIRLIRQAYALPIVKMSRVLIVEDDAGWRSIYEEILSDAGYALQTAISYGEARGWLQRLEFALAIVDLRLISSAAPQDNRDGFWFLRAAQQRGLPTIVVSALGEPDDIDRAYEEFGVFAFVEKEGFDRRAFLRTAGEAIRSRPIELKASTPPMDSAAPSPAAPDRMLSELTEREREVLAQLAQGYTNRQISETLGITPNTVKKHVDHILQKLQVSSRAGAVAVALRAGLN
jgi:DNA-binding NarL/FixJ family response regulator